MHDILELDRRGIPGGMVATTEFEAAAEAQAEALSFRPAVVYVPHPIQNRTAEELRRIADHAVEPILQMLCTAPALGRREDFS